MVRSAGESIGDSVRPAIARLRPTKSLSRSARLAKATSLATGRLPAFIVAVGVILAWVVTGPLFRFGDTWQLVINTGYDDHHVLDGIPHSEYPNRDGEAVQGKLDELPRATAGCTTPSWTRRA